jgi:hypothetical protein
MATKATRTIRMEQQLEPWECRLLASHERVRKNDAVTLTCILSHPLIGDVDPADSEFYDCFVQKYDAHDELVSFPDENPSVLRMPGLPHGSLRVDVRVTLDNGDALSVWFNKHRNGSDDLPEGAWNALEERLLVDTRPPAALHASHTFSVVTHPFDVRATVNLQPSAIAMTDDAALGVAIRNRTAAVGFDRYKKYIDSLFSGDESSGMRASRLIEKGIAAFTTGSVDEPRKEFPGVDTRLNVQGPYAYPVLKLATQTFLMLESGVVIRGNEDHRPKILYMDRERSRFDDPNLSLHELEHRLQNYLVHYNGLGPVLPYLNRVVSTFIGLHGKEVLPYCEGILQHRLSSPSLVELIWSYWHEEGMLVRTMNAIARRFQNRRSSRRDPLTDLAFDPLRPLSNLLWGYVHDDPNRLTIEDRSSEYANAYGLTLTGISMRDVAPADNRSKFIAAFHNLLACTARFYREDADTTVRADGFPLLNALKDVHLILADGLQNQLNDLTWTARSEMLMTQWLLARPEMREFLRGRYMVPYDEPWMGAVDSMKRLQGWTDTSVIQFHDLALTGERILLSIRWGDWTDFENIEDQARLWARQWTPEIKKYIYALRAVTGVDLSSDVTDSRDAALRYVQPSLLLRRRLAEQRSSMLGHAPRPLALAAPRSAGHVEPAWPRRQPKLLSYKDN